MTKFILYGKEYEYDESRIKGLSIDLPYSSTKNEPGGFIRIFKDGGTEKREWDEGTETYKLPTNKKE